MLLRCRGPKIDEAYNKWEGTAPDDDRRAGRKQNWEYLVAEKARLQAERAALSAGGLHPRTDLRTGSADRILFRPSAAPHPDPPHPAITEPEKLYCAVNPH